MLRWLLAAAALWPPAADPRGGARAEDAAAGEEVCDATGCPDAAAAAARQLRWRVASYKDAKKAVYGGAFVAEAFADVGFEGPVEDDDWDLFFTHYPMGKAIVSAGLPPRPGRLVNHCQYFTAAGQKCRLAGHMARVDEALNRSGSTSRQLSTFLLKRPEQAAAWREALRARPERHWLLKTCSGGASKGITLVSSADTRAIEDAVGTWVVAQEYLHEPLLSAGGRKFHLRLYLLVTRWDPVGVFLYNEGLVFRSRHAHDGSKPSQARDIFSSVSQDVEPLMLAAVWEELGPDRASTAKSRMISVLAEVFGHALRDSFGDPTGLARERGFDCFDLFGVDLMFDVNLQPYVLEVNMGPNMWVDRQGQLEEKLLRAVKEPLVKQLAAWTVARIRLRPEAALEELSAAEEAALLDFARVL